jgi:hypothetical protein
MARTFGSLMVGLAVVGLSVVVRPVYSLAQTSPLTLLTLEELSALEVFSVSSNPQP